MLAPSDGCREFGIIRHKLVPEVTVAEAAGDVRMRVRAVRHDVDAIGNSVGAVSAARQGSGCVDFAVDDIEQHRIAATGDVMLSFPGFEFRCHVVISAADRRGGTGEGRESRVPLALPVAMWVQFSRRAGGLQWTVTVQPHPVMEHLATRTLAEPVAPWR